MNFVTILCSKGRPIVLDETVVSILKQDSLPSKILLVVTCNADFLESTLLRDERVMASISPVAGLTAQRNYGISCIQNQNVEITIFLDDDVELEISFFTKMLYLFSKYPDIIGISAESVIGGASADRSYAKKVINDLNTVPMDRLKVRDSGKYCLCHGCNMFFRTSLFGEELFDEELPLYSYGEDYDFSLRASRHGKVGKVSGIGFAHLTYPGGRVSEKKRGYSIVANNYYFLKKRVQHVTIFLGYIRFWLVIVFKETFSVGIKSITLNKNYHRTYRDHFFGRCLAVFDVIRGNSSPNKILKDQRFD
tara:strand:+ start:954 stop:1874 length:921 start_codon:yes stop_codon:yes gene_type:complete